MLLNWYETENFELKFFHVSYFASMSNFINKKNQNTKKKLKIRLINIKKFSLAWEMVEAFFINTFLNTILSKCVCILLDV